MPSAARAAGVINADAPGPQADDGERTAHSRLPWPGISTIAKYGPRPSSRLGKRHDALVRHGAALDIERALEQTSGLDGATHLRQIAADLHDDRRIGLRQPLDQFVLGAACPAARPACRCPR